MNITENFEKHKNIKFKSNRDEPKLELKLDQL